MGGLAVDVFDGRSVSGAGITQPILSMIVGTAISRGLLADIVPPY
jgi:hypothetical protein